MIRPWLEHFLALPQVKAIYIQDGGSTDRTIEYIKSIQERDSRVFWWEYKSNSFSDSRNHIIKAVKQRNISIDWLMFCDIDEIFSTNYEELFEMLEDIDLSDYDIIRFPHIKMYDFNKLWFHLPPTMPSYDGNIMKYSIYKDTIALFRLSAIGIYNNPLHEQLEIKSKKPYLLASLLKRENLNSLDLLQDDVFVIHYTPAKFHAQARRINKSFEYCVGVHRAEYRKIEPKTYFGQKYDMKWAENASESEIEQLGRAQMKQFFIEGHCYVKPNFDVYELNNDYIRKYFSKLPVERNNLW